jgi:rhamnulokinase
MRQAANFLAADLGASSGRLMVGSWDGRSFSLSELHRFPNGAVRAGDGLYWNALGLWTQVQEGLAKYQAAYSGTPASIGVDAWGVDFALLDRCGRLLGNPRNYRDPRTDGLPAQVFATVDEQEIFRETGVQTMQINTLFQLASMAKSGDPQLENARALLMIPDLFLYLLSGELSNEFSEATTTQMYSIARQDWTRDILTSLEVPVEILGPVVQPGTVVGRVRQDVLQEAGLRRPFPAIATASHDTASAVAAIPNMDRESAFICSGTWSLLGTEIDKPITSSDALRLDLTNEGGANGAVLLMRNLTGLWIVQECLREWQRQGQHAGWEEIIGLAASTPSSGSFIDPNATEFQSPGEMPRRICDYCKRSRQQVPQSTAQIARCAFESLSLSYRMALDAIEYVSRRSLSTLRIVGGGSLNSFLNQMIADVCGRQVIAGPAEASALGNVMMQAIAMGHLQDVAEGRAALTTSFTCSSYHPQRSDAWDEAYARFQGIVQRTALD